MANGEPLKEKYKDHALHDTKYYRNCRDSYIELDIGL